MIDWLLEHPRCALWAGMGIGKSSAALLAFDIMRILGTVTNTPTLVCGPANVARDTWTEEAAKWEQFAHLEIIPLVGTPAERRRLLKLDRPFFTVSYELLPWLVEQWLARWPYRSVIADESDRLKGIREKKGGVENGDGTKRGASGARAFQIGRVAHTLVDRWVNLTGTPTPLGLLDLWGQTWFIDRGQRLGRTYTAYLQRWFRKKFSGYGLEPMPHAFEQITGALRDVCLTVDPKDYFDLAEPIVVVKSVKLPPKVRQMYRSMENDYYLELGPELAVETFSSGAARQKLMQIANGAIYTNRERTEWSVLHDAKIEMLKSVQHEASGMPLLVSYVFRHDLARLKEAFPKAVELSTAAGMKAFKSGGAPMGLAHPKSLGHGIDGLQYVTNMLVRFGHYDNAGERLQMTERIGPMRQLQAGFERPVWIFDIVAENTVDEDIAVAERDKLDVQTAVLSAMKRRAEDGG